MAVRNFWIEADIDGRRTPLASGPRAKDGGFRMTIYQRDRGGIIQAANIVAEERDEELVLVVHAYHSDGEIVHSVRTAR